MAIVVLDISVECKVGSCIQVVGLLSHISNTSKGLEHILQLLISNLLHFQVCCLLYL